MHSEGNRHECIICCRCPWDEARQKCRRSCMSVRCVRSSGHTAVSHPEECQTPLLCAWRWRYRLIGGPMSATHHSGWIKITACVHHGTNIRVWWEPQLLIKGAQYNKDKPRRALFTSSPAHAQCQRFKFSSPAHAHTAYSRVRTALYLIERIITPSETVNLSSDAHSHSN